MQDCIHVGLSAKEPHISAEEPHISGKITVYPQKSPKCPQKSPLYPKRDLHQKRPHCTSTASGQVILQKQGSFATEI